MTPQGVAERLRHQGHGAGSQRPGGRSTGGIRSLDFDVEFKGSLK